MAIKLPNNGYDAMVFLNWLANAGAIGEIHWNVAGDGPQGRLIEIKAKVSGVVTVERPGNIIEPGGLVTAGPGLKGKHKLRRRHE